MNIHIPVLLSEVLEYLRVKPEGIYIDCTLGEGGHAEAILKKGAKVIGIEQDEEILKIAKKRLNKYNITFIHDNFKNIVVDGSVDGILYDLGLSSFHLESKTRGFSFKYDAPLDMRLDLRNKTTAKDLVNQLSQKELAQIILKYGEEHKANKIAKAIIKNRPISTTFELIKAIEHVLPKYKRIHPATKVFQALRIAVNRELDVLDESLDEALPLLKKGGRMVMISYHSLEDRIIKHKFRRWAEDEWVKIITKHPIKPTQEEIKANPRARSAKLRVVEKI
jgi:16S rRNA (cytosine1402-N4)-methyltransferase